MKYAFVSGGQGYVGSAIVEELRARGFEVVAPPAAQCDVSDFVSVEQALAGISQLDAVVHAAAVPLERVPLAEVSVASFDRAIAVAAGGAFNLAQAARRKLAPGAAFVGITTQAIEPGRPVSEVGAYLPAKYALRGVLRSLAGELPCRVYAVAPGFLPGGLNADLPSAMLEMLAKKSQTPQEVAALAVALIEDQAAPSGSYLLPRQRSDF